MKDYKPRNRAARKCSLREALPGKVGDLTTELEIDAVVIIAILLIAVGLYGLYA